MNPNFTQNPNPGNQGTIEALLTFPEVSNLVKKKFLDLLPNQLIDAKPLFIFDSVPTGQGNSVQKNEIDFTTYARNKPEGANTQKGSMGIGFHQSVGLYRYGLEFDITWEMRTTQQWVNVVNLTAEALAQAVPQRINLDMTHMLTFGNAVSYVDMDGVVRNTSTGDGLSLFNAAHLLTFSATTYSNLVPGNPLFTKTALEAAELLAKYNIFDNFGVMKQMSFKTIWCADTPNLTNDIMQYIRSTSDPVQANPGVENPYKGKYDILPLSKLATDASGAPDPTKFQWWGIAALTGMGGSRWQAYHMQWEAPMMKPMPTGSFSTTNAEDVHNDNWTYGSRGASNFMAVVAKGIIASLAV